MTSLLFSTFEVSTQAFSSYFTFFSIVSPESLKPIVPGHGRKDFAFFFLLNHKLEESWLTPFRCSRSFKSSCSTSRWSWWSNFMFAQTRWNRGAKNLHWPSPVRFYSIFFSNILHAFFKIEFHRNILGRENSGSISSTYILPWKFENLNDPFASRILRRRDIPRNDSVVSLPLEC